MGNKGCWEGTYYRVENPMKYEYPLYHTPDEYSHLYTGMFGDWTGYQGHWVPLAWDELLGGFTGGWVEDNPGAFREFELVAWNEIPRWEVDSFMLSQYGPAEALREDRLSSTETTELWTKHFSGAFEYDNYCALPISGWPAAAASQAVKSTGQWRDPVGSLYDEQGKTFNRQYTNLSEVGHPLNTPLAIHMEKNPDIERVPNFTDLENLGHYNDVYVAKVGQVVDEYSRISGLEYYASRPNNGDLPLGAGEKCWEYAREQPDGTKFWIIEDYDASQFNDYDTETQTSATYNVYKGFMDNDTPGNLVQSGPDNDYMWVTQNWTQLADDTLSDRREQWIIDNCTGDDWVSPRPGCDVNCDGLVKFETVRSTT
tara:strand:+ start:1264 stop:2373 length:1110 start_codon:yes stop_codon:yes gene_type:complete